MGNKVDEIMALVTYEVSVMLFGHEGAHRFIQNIMKDVLALRLREGIEEIIDDNKADPGEEE
jgi:hypothetical protein